MNINWSKKIAARGKWKPPVTHAIWPAVAAMILALMIVGHAQSVTDLIVSGAVVNKDRSGVFVQNITVTVKNVCGATAPTSYVLVTFKASNAPNAKAIYYIGNTVRALRGGQSYTQTFDLSTRKIDYGRFVFIEVDPYEKVAEANENNNWRTLFPSDSGASASNGTCSQ